jgi:hypothetical protein
MVTIVSDASTMCWSRNAHPTMSTWSDTIRATNRYWCLIERNCSAVWHAFASCRAASFRCLPNWLILRELDLMLTREWQQVIVGRRRRMQ